MLEVSEVFKQEEGKKVLQDISFVQNIFQKMAIAGESGSGKTTLLKIIGGLTQPDGGTVLFKNKRVEGPEEKLIPGHPQIAYLSQHFELRNHYRVEEILEYANKLSNEDALRLYSVCRIDHLLKRWTTQLSGGEKQRIALARLLTASPEWLLLDEPYSNLDLIHKDILKSVINELGVKLKITCLLTSHDPNDILSWADEIIIMREGNIIQKGSPEDIYSYPLNEYVAGLFGKYNIVNEQWVKIFPCLATDKRKFLRPQDFRITETDENCLQGTITAMNYMGSHYEIEVLLPGNSITVRSSSGNYLNSQSVCVAIND